MFWIATVIVVCFYTSIYIFKRKKWADCINKIPGMKTLPVLGNIWQMRINLPFSKPAVHPLTAVLQFREGLRVLFPNDPIVRVWVTFRPSILFFKPSAVEKLLSSNVSIDKSVFYNLLHPWLGQGLLTSTGDKWKRTRKLLTPAFHFRILNDFFPIMNKHTKYMIQNISTEHPVDIVPLMSLCTLDIICETAMGVTVNAQKNSQSSYVASVQNISFLIMKRASQPWLWNNILYYLTKEGQEFRRCVRNLHHFTEKVIKEKLVGYEDSVSNLENAEGKKRRLAFLDLLLKEYVTKKTFSLTEVREEVDTFMFEGHDTTSVGITWALYLIGLHESVQQRIHQELDEIFNNDNEDITFEDCNNMKYLECVIQESQRLYPSVPVLMRTLGEDTEIDGYLIPKGTNVSVQVYVIHRDPQIHSNPEVFNPDRFLKDTSSARHTFSYIPFSAGPRNCIGKRFAMLEEKVIIASILRRFLICSLQPRDEVIIIPELVLRPMGKVNIKFTRRLMDC